MANENTLYLVLFILLMSSLFPMVGYYLDWRKRKEDRTPPPPPPSQES